MARFKKKSTSHNHLDRALIKKTQGSGWPRLAQIKYLPRFLQPNEKKLLTVSLSILLVSSLLGATLFTSAHIERIPADGGEYNEALIGQPKYINPLFASADEADSDLSNLIFAGLFHYSTDKTLQPYIAASYEISADQKTYDIMLRPGVRWSDGQPLTADDVIFTFESIQNPEVGSALLSAFQGVKIEKIAEDHIRFILKEPFAPFIDSLTVGIIPMHIWGDIPPSTMKLAKQNLEQVVGAGAWRFSKLFKDTTGHVTSYVLTRNENYFDQKPHLTSLRFSFFDTYQEAINAMRTDAVLGLSFVPHALENKINRRSTNLYNLTLPQYTALFFNQAKQPILKDSNVRTALAMAIDKNALVQDALGGSGITIDAPIASSSIGYAPNIKKIAFDPTAANTLLDKTWNKIQPEEYFSLLETQQLKAAEDDIAAFKKANTSSPAAVTEYQNSVKQAIDDGIRKDMDPGQTFYRRDKNNTILQMVITTADTPEYSKTAELMSRMWQAIGVKTTVKKISSQQIISELLQKRNYQTLVYGEVIGFDPDPFPFWHSSQADYPGLNLSSYVNKDADKLLDQARGTTDANKRSALYVQFQDLLAKDLPAIFLYTQTYTVAANSHIKGIEMGAVNAPADRFLTIGNWYSKTKWRWK